MKLRPKKKNSEEDGDADERGQKKRKGPELKRSRGSPIMVPGSSPAKKPRTHRPRVAGNKLPHFLLDPEKQKRSGDTESQSQSQAQDDDVSDDDDFNNVVKAVALTLAEASQNGSESETPAKDEEHEAQEGSDDEVANEPVKPPPKPRRAPDPPVRRPPSKRIRNQREREQEIEDEEAEEPKHQKRVQPQRSKKRSRQLFSGEDVSGLDTLATLANLSLSGLLPDSDSEKGDGASGDLQELVSQVVSLQVERPAKKQVEMKEHNTRSKVSPKKKKKPAEKDDKSQPYVRARGSKRVQTTKNKQTRVEEDESKRSKGTRSSVPHRAHCRHTTPELGIFSTKARLLHCLGSGREDVRYNARLWSIYEWFYSAIDLPWFSRNEFVEYLHHAGLGHVSKLTRVEWGVIRNSLGRPRRLSQKFMQEERQKLADYRDTVRRHYDEFRNDKSGALPPDLPRPLTVGQRVIARHPDTGEISDGRILTVDRDKFRVQFDRTELGVEFVQDIDAMPVNPVENMSEVMKKKRSVDNRAAQLNERLDRPAHPYASPSQYFLSTLFHRAQMDNVDSVLLAKAAATEAASAAQQGEDGQEREADVSALADLSRQLDKKEALLVELRRMNDEADRCAGEAEAPGSLESFKRQYATVVLQLKQVNKQVAAAVLHLRERNKYKDNLVPPWHSPAPAPVDPVTTGLGAGSPAEEITLTAKKDAASLVSATVEAICCLREGENVGKTLNSDGEQATSKLQQAQGSDKGDASLQPAGGGEKLRKEAAFTSSMQGLIPRDYISSCVATVLMIQMCAESRQLPHSDVAVMFENALASLRPRSAQNHQLYKEVEQLFDVLKNQVTAEVSFRPSLPLPVDCFK